jgi:hypothetical protein
MEQAQKPDYVEKTAIIICFVPLVPFHSGTEQTEQDFEID